eukprot:scpid70372/ scgid6953/ Carbonic anhydrase 2; Carbonate dehydratase II; Carbonic anhydrase II
MFLLGCVGEVVSRVGGAWRAPLLIPCSRVAKSTSSGAQRPTVAFLRSASQANSRFFSTSTSKKSSDMSWSHRPSLGCADVTEWQKHFPAAAGKRQSPIDLTKGEYNEELAGKALQISYKEARECTLVNNGHSVQVNFKPSIGGLTGGPVTDNFEIAQYHFHWGAGDDKGSEHTVDGKYYPNELHLVHWNTSKFSSVSEAISEPNGLTVLGIFLEAGEENVELKKITDRFDKVKHCSQEIPIEDPICLKGLLPEDTKSFWSYDGSLTTPPCYESVNWIVFRKPITVSKEQLAAFRSLDEAKEGSDPEQHQALVDNYRPVCELNDRKLSTTFEE